MWKERKLCLLGYMMVRVCRCWRALDYLEALRSWWRPRQAISQEMWLKRLLKVEYIRRICATFSEVAISFAEEPIYWYHVSVPSNLQTTFDYILSGEYCHPDRRVVPISESNMVASKQKESRAAYFIVERFLLTLGIPISMKCSSWFYLLMLCALLFNAP